MAVTISPEGQLVFFAKVFGPSHPVVGKVKALVQSGVTFEVSLYGLRAYVGKKALEPATLSYGTTALMKGTVSAEVLIHNKKLIEDWVSYLYAKQGSPSLSAKPVPPTSPGPTSAGPLPWHQVSLTGVQGNKLVLIKAITQIKGIPLNEAKDVVLGVQNGPVLIGTYESANKAKQAATLLEKAGGVLSVEPVKVSIDPAKPGSPLGTPVTVSPVTPGPYSWDVQKPVDSVIPLKDAKALGQKVHGTSHGSVYHCIALSEHVKVAAKLSHNGSISLRTEWTDSPKDDLKKLEEAGLVMKGEYGSMHFDAAGVDLKKVVGAFLFSTGIAWKAVITNGAELVIA